MLSPVTIHMFNRTRVSALIHSSQTNKILEEYKAITRTGLEVAQNLEGTVNPPPVQYYFSGEKRQNKALRHTQGQYQLQAELISLVNFFLARLARTWSHTIRWAMSQTWIFHKLTHPPGLPHSEHSSSLLQGPN
jgi:hypothetical protein